MGYTARVIADSVSPAGVRLTTLEVRFPRFILAEVNTHRVFSRSSASSRAIPVHKRIESAQSEPFVPGSFGVNRPGMQAVEDLGAEAAARAGAIWRRLADGALASLYEGCLESLRALRLMIAVRDGEMP